MNVIITARQKTQYADSGFMRAIGETFDGEKSLPYPIVQSEATMVIPQSSFGADRRFVRHRQVS